MQAPADIAFKHCYSMRLVRPFLAALAKRPNFPADILAPLWEMDPDARLPIGTLHELMRGAIELTGDADIGLAAAHEIEQGDLGALEYAVSSAPTSGRALEIIGRYLALVNDALRFRLATEEDGRAIVVLDSTVKLPRAAADYQSAAFFRVSQHVQNARPGDFGGEAWFAHSAPNCRDGYARAFPGCGLRFDAPFNGFAFDAEVLTRPMPAADPKLHQLIRRHADDLLKEVPNTGSLTQRVRDLLVDELPGGNPNALRIASLLGISSRTLTRRLVEEGATFKELLDDLRRDLALRYVGTTDHGFAEIALLLGYAEPAAFHRAFKRWTGLTPGDHRRETRHT